jgi:hypothetical protein
MVVSLALVTSMRASKAFDREEVNGVLSIIEKTERAHKREAQESHYCNSVLKKRQQEIQDILAKRLQTISETTDPIDNRILSFLARRHVKLERELSRIDAKIEEHERE